MTRKLRLIWHRGHTRWLGLRLLLLHESSILLSHSAGIGSIHLWLHRPSHIHLLYSILPLLLSNNAADLKR